MIEWEIKRVVGRRRVLHASLRRTYFVVPLDVDIDQNHLCCLAFRRSSTEVPALDVAYRLDWVVCVPIAFETVHPGEMAHLAGCRGTLYCFDDER